LLHSNTLYILVTSEEQWLAISVILSFPCQEVNNSVTSCVIALL